MGERDDLAQPSKVNRSPTAGGEGCVDTLVTTLNLIALRGSTGNDGSLMSLPKKSPMKNTKIDPTSEWMTPQDVANLIHITAVTVRTWIKEDRLPACRFGPKMIRIKRSDVEALMAPLPTTPWPDATMQKLDDIRRALGALNVGPMPAAVPPHPISRGRAEASGPRVSEQEVAPPTSAPEPLA